MQDRTLDSSDRTNVQSEHNYSDVYQKHTDAVPDRGRVEVAAKPNVEGHHGIETRQLFQHCSLLRHQFDGATERDGISASGRRRDDRVCRADAARWIVPGSSDGRLYGVEHVQFSKHHHFWIVDVPPQLGLDDVPGKSSVRRTSGVHTTVVELRIRRGESNVVDSRGSELQVRTKCTAVQTIVHDDRIDRLWVDAAPDCIRG